jgi:hypothetical protein
MNEDREGDDLTTLDWEEWLERTDVDIDKDRPASEILRQWRRQRRLAPTNCSDCGMTIDSDDQCIQASWEVFDGEERLGTGTVLYCTDCVPPGMRIE